MRLDANPRDAPRPATTLFERAQKLYIIGWFDLELVKAAELVALTALEFAVTNQYHYKERERRSSVIGDKIAKSGKNPSPGQTRWVEAPFFADLLKYMVEFDDLTEELIPMNIRCGPQSNVLDSLTGKRAPSLADIRNGMAHRSPFADLPWAGLLELIRDLIDYAYRDRCLLA